MKSILNLIGVALMIGGILALSYQGFHYTKQEEIAKIGDLKITGETQKKVYFPPLLGGLAIAAGVIVLVVANKK
jgi:hypothetical protein